MNRALAIVLFCFSPFVCKAQWYGGPDITYIYLSHFLLDSGMHNWGVTNLDGYMGIPTNSLPPLFWTGSWNQITDKPTIPSAQIQTDWSQSASGSTDFIKNKPTMMGDQVSFLVTRTPASSPSSYVISTTNNSWVTYSIRISTALTISGGQHGGVLLEVSTNNSNWMEVSRVENGNTGTVVVGINTTQPVVSGLSGFVPKNYFVRLKTTNIVGTPTYTYISGQETLQQ